MTSGFWFPAVLCHIENWNQKTEVTGQDYIFIKFGYILCVLFLFLVKRTTTTKQRHEPGWMYIHVASKPTTRNPQNKQSMCEIYLTWYLSACETGLYRSCPFNHKSARQNCRRRRSIFILFSEKIRLNIFCESSAFQRSHLSIIRIRLPYIP